MTVLTNGKFLGKHVGLLTGEKQFCSCYSLYYQVELEEPNQRNTAKPFVQVTATSMSSAFEPLPLDLLKLIWTDFPQFE